MIWRTSDSTALRIYTTVIPATNRFYTFMHDPQYRESIAWQNVAYNQPPHTSFYMGYGMNPPPIPPVSSATLVWHGDGVSNTWDVTTTTNWYDNWQISGIWTSSTADVFTQGNSVLFDLSGSNNVPINLGRHAGHREVVTVYSPNDYVFGGSGWLTGHHGARQGWDGRADHQHDQYLQRLNDGQRRHVMGQRHSRPKSGDRRGSLWGLGMRRRQRAVGRRFHSARPEPA